jgi:hypothetical protein
MVDALLQLLHADDWTALDPQYVVIQILMRVGLLVVVCHVVVLCFDTLGPASGAHANAAGHGAPWTRKRAPALGYDACVQHSHLRHCLLKPRLVARRW